jgi:arylsulfatase
VLPLAGESLATLFKGQPKPSNRNLYWEHEGNRAVRQGKWKLVSRYPENRWSLYDLANDPTELNDLSNGHPDKVKSLTKQYETWASRTGVIPWTEVISRRK